MKQLIIILLTVVPYLAYAQNDTLDYFDMRWYTPTPIGPFRMVYYELHLLSEEKKLMKTNPQYADSLKNLAYQRHLDWIDEQNLGEYINWTAQKYLKEYYKPRLTKADRTPGEIELLLHTKPLKRSMFPEYLWVDYFTVRLAADYMNKALLDSIKTLGKVYYDRIMSKKGKDRDFYVFLENVIGYDHTILMLGQLSTLSPKSKIFFFKWELKPTKIYLAMGKKSDMHKLKNRHLVPWHKLRKKSIEILDLEEAYEKEFYDSLSNPFQEDIFM